MILKPIKQQRIKPMNDREPAVTAVRFGQNSRAISPRGSSVTAPFNSRSEPLWGFREIIKPGAFDDVLTTMCADCLTMTRISFLGAARRERYR
jgi:phage head maturation protease